MAIGIQDFHIGRSGHHSRIRTSVRRSNFVTHIMGMSRQQTRRSSLAFNMDFTSRIGLCDILTFKAYILRSNRHRAAFLVDDIEACCHRITRRIVRNDEAHNFSFNRTIIHILDRIRHSNSLVSTRNTRYRHLGTATLAIVLAGLCFDLDSHRFLSPLRIEILVAIRRLRF